jgi:predicted small secreted protein
MMKLIAAEIFSLFDVIKEDSLICVQLMLNKPHKPEIVYQTWLTFDKNDSPEKVEVIIKLKTKIGSSAVEKILTKFSNYCKSENRHYYLIHWFKIGKYFFRIVNIKKSDKFLLLITENEFSRNRVKNLKRTWHIINKERYFRDECDKYFSSSNINFSREFAMQWNFFINNKFKEMLNLTLSIKE